MKKKTNGKVYYILIGLIFLIINVLASFINLRLDITAENKYSINKATATALKQLEEPLHIEVFLKDNLPAGFKKLANSTSDFLGLLKQQNPSKINYSFIAPDEVINGSNTTYQDTLLAMGAKPINLTVQKKRGQETRVVFPYALISYKDQAQLISLYSGTNRFISQDEINNAEAMLEYKFLKAINDFLNPHKPFIAYNIANGEPTDIRTYDLLQTLQPNYQFFTFNLKERPFIPDTFKLFITVKPTQGFTEDEKLKIDQYVMRGGSVLCFIDNLNAEQDSLSLKPELVAYDRNLNLTDLFFKYGVRINTDLVMDLQSDFMPFAVGGTRENPQFEFLKWNYYPLFESKNNHPINKNLGLVAGKFVNSIDTVKANGIQKTILLSSSANARKLGTPALISLNENRNAAEDKLFNQSNIPVAVLLEGTFTSLYKNRLSTHILDSLKKINIPFVFSGIKPGKIIIVADGDMVLNSVSKQQGPLPMGMNVFTLGTQYEYQFANREFLLNAVEYLTAGESLMKVRNKDFVLRLLDAKKVNAEKLNWQIINTILPVVLIIVVGLLYNYARNKKYAA